jgi:peptidoglycan/xylan/chitin deacetylase (PgdA/CDA1 family)
MGIRLSGGFAFLIAPLLLCGSVVAAAGGECPGHPDALGTSRTIVVDPRDHIRIGTMSYVETLPLVDKEVVLTFDDGPLPPYTNRILDILASECIHATYFIVGAMAKAYPDQVRRIHDAGHTIGTHSMTHPYPFRTQGLERSKAQIDEGIAATAAALGDPAYLAPFFRFPGFGRTEPVEEYLASRGLMVWGADMPADDWKKIGAAEVARRAVRRLEARGKGILLLHDIHERTVEALPIIISELKAQGFRIVHVVPAGENRPATFTTAEAWLPRQRPSPALPVILIAAVQNPDGDILLKKSAAALCSLRRPAHETKPVAQAKAPVHEPPIRVASRRHSRRSHVAHMPPATRAADLHAVQ